MFAHGERIDGRVVFGVGVFERGACAFEFGVLVGGSGGDDGGVLVAFGAQFAVEGPGVVVGGEGLAISAAQRGGDDFAGAALVGEESWWVVGVGAGVPGVGGLLPAGLADVAGVPVECGGAEEVDLVPGAALGAVDGACPRMRDVGCAVGAGPGDRCRGQEDLASLVEEHGGAVGSDGTEGAGGPVEHRSVGTAAEVGVHEDAITGGVDAWGGSPARTLECRAAELAAGGADGADPIGEVFAVGVADREDRDVLGAVSVGVRDCCVRERVASLELVSGVRVPSPRRVGSSGCRRRHRRAGWPGRAVRRGRVGGGSRSASPTGWHRRLRGARLR